MMLARAKCESTFLNVKAYKCSDSSIPHFMVILTDEMMMTTPVTVTPIYPKIPQNETSSCPMIPVHISCLHEKSVSPNPTKTLSSQNHIMQYWSLPKHIV